MSKILTKKNQTQKNNFLKTLLGLLVLLIIILFISIKLVHLFYSKTSDPYAILIKDYYSSLNRGNTNITGTLISDDFKSEIPATMWLGNNSRVFIFSSRELTDTNTIVGSHVVFFCVINTRQNTAFLNEAYILNDDKRILLTYIKNLHRAQEVRK